MIGELLEIERLRDGQSLKKARQDLVPVLKRVARTFDDRPRVLSWLRGRHRSSQMSLPTAYRR